MADQTAAPARRRGRHIGRVLRGRDSGSLELKTGLRSQPVYRGTVHADDEHQFHSSAHDVIAHPEHAAYGVVNDAQAAAGKLEGLPARREVTPGR